jgi:hypothetical protein
VKERSIPAMRSSATAWSSAVELHALNGVPFPDRPAGEADLWHGIVDTTGIRRELGFRPYHPSVWSARDAGAL